MRKTIACLALAVGILESSGAHAADVQKAAVALPLAELTAAPQPARPVQVDKSFSLKVSQHETQADVYTVPDGMRLVIEYVSFAYDGKTTGDGAVQRLRLATSVGGAAVWHDVMTIPGTRERTGGSQLVKIYADPRTKVVARIERAFSPIATVRVSLSGRLEPVDGAAQGTKVQ